VKADGQTRQREVKRGELAPLRGVERQ
jgi:hypothetical protein